MSQAWKEPPGQRLSTRHLARTGNSVWCRLDLGEGAAIEDRGIGVGLGLRVGSGDFGFYLETRYEFLDANDPWVSRLGVVF